MDRLSPEQLLLEVIQLLTGRLSARGKERALAADVVAWGVRHFPQIHWQLVDVTTETGPTASVLATSSRDADSGGLLLYSHLDTSLSGDLTIDEPILGRVVRSPELRIDRDARTVSGLGLGVAKGPAAAAVAAFVAAATHLSETSHRYRLQLLLACGGTHRTVESAFATGSSVRTGVEEFLASQRHPDAVVVAKAGPRGILYDEPGALYFRIRITGQWGPVMWRHDVNPDGGVAIYTGLVIDAIESWCRDFVRTCEPGEQSGAEAGIGSIHAGLREKPDLVPAVLDVYGYLVHPRHADHHAIRADLDDHLRQSLRNTALDMAGVAVETAVVRVAQGETTTPSSTLICAAEQAWRGVRSAAPPAVTGWKGSTDGVVFRSQGIDTVRIGPVISTASMDGVDTLDLDDLLECRQIYAHIARTVAVREPASIIPASSSTGEHHDNQSGIS